MTQRQLRARGLPARAGFSALNTGSRLLLVVAKAARLTAWLACSAVPGSGWKAFGVVMALLLASEVLVYAVETSSAYRKSARPAARRALAPQAVRTEVA